jgi:hypothetical protein
MARPLSRSPETRRLTSPQMSTHRFKGAEAPLTFFVPAAIVRDVRVGRICGHCGAWP